MRRGRVSLTAAAVHALSTLVPVPGREPACRYGALCRASFPTYDDRGRPGGWNYTDEPVTCLRCVAKLEQLAEQAMRDEQAIAVMSEIVVRKPAVDPERVRAMRRAWPAMGRAVADLLRHRGIQLGEGWLGPARIRI